jgi:preprotein translocase subunit SecY
VASISSFPILEPPLGFRERVPLSILTAGVFPIIYAVWAFLVAKQVSVTAIRDEPSWTKLTVEASEPFWTTMTTETSELEHAEPLVAWVQRELIENRVAARVETF